MRNNSNTLLKPMNLMRVSLLVAHLTAASALEKGFPGPGQAVSQADPFDIYSPRDIRNTHNPTHAHKHTLVEEVIENSKQAKESLIPETVPPRRNDRRHFQRSLSAEREVRRTRERLRSSEGWRGIKACRLFKY